MNDIIITQTPEEAAVAALEQAAFDGKPVTAAELAAAKEKVGLAGIIQKGKDHRADQKRIAGVAAAKVQAKKDAAELMSNHSDVPVLTAYQGVVTALSELGKVVGEYNALQAQIHGLFDSVDLPAFVSSADEQPSDLDLRNHALFYERMDPTRAPRAPYAIVVDGVTHSIASASTYARLAASSATQIPAGVSVPAILTRVEK